VGIGRRQPGIVEAHERASQIPRGERLGGFAGTPDSQRDQRAFDQLAEAQSPDPQPRPHPEPTGRLAGGPGPDADGARTVRTHHLVVADVEDDEIGIVTRHLAHDRQHDVGVDGGYGGVHDLERHPGIPLFQQHLEDPRQPVFGHEIAERR
jgi:hypothetical protein